jgi:hypothetical protein
VEQPGVIAEWRARLALRLQFQPPRIDEEGLQTQSLLLIDVGGDLIERVELAGELGADGAGPVIEHAQQPVWAPSAAEPEGRCISARCSSDGGGVAVGKLRMTNLGKRGHLGRSWGIGWLAAASCAAGGA